MAYKFYNPNPVGRMTNDCSGQVSQAEYNQAVQQANQLYSMMNGR